jgi:hypothetical protein
MVKHFLLPLMKRKNNSKLNEGAQIPYSLQDFKEGDRVHVIGVFDGENFDDLGTIVTTSREIENPWSKEDSILVKFDDHGQREYGFHDGETGIREIAVKCYGKCWWIWLASFIPNYVSNPDDYYYKKNNRVIKLNDNLPSAYDVISSLYESKDLIGYVYPDIKVGDEVIVSFGYKGDVFADNELATVLDITYSGWILLKFKTWNQGHNGHNDPKCGDNDCFYVKANDSSFIFSNLVVKRLDMPDAYDVISSLYESKEDDLDWAMDMAKDIANKSIELSLIPKNKDKNFYLIYFDKPGITYETIQNILTYVKESTIWGNTMTLRDVEALVPYLYDNYLEKGFVYFSLKPDGQSGYGSTENAFSKVNNIKITAPNVKIIRPYPYGENINESDDFDWASDMVNDVNSGSLMTVIQKIPTTVDKDKFNVIVFRGPGITKKDITDVIMFTENNTNYTPFFNVETIIDNAINMYNKERFLYINLRPNGVKSVGSSPFTFKVINKVSLSDDRVNVIKFNDNKKINESDDLDWASDMVNDVDLNSATMSVITQIPTTVDPVRFHYIGFKGPGITEKNIADVVWFTEKNTNYKPFVDAANTIDNIYNLYLKNGVAYIVLKPSNQKAVGSSPSAFEIINKVKMNNPKEVNVIKFNADKKINESDDLDWAMDMVNNVNLAMTSIPTEDDGKKYVILFDKPGITYETIEAIVKYIEKKTVWYFTDENSVTSSIYGDIKRGRSPYIRLFPGPELNYGDDEDTFNASTGLYFNSPQVNIIRPY